MNRLALAVAAASIAVAVLAGPVAAYHITYENGPHGDVYLDDTSTTPAATCQYGNFVYANWTYLKSVQVRAPHVFAADRNSAKRDHRTVTWRFNLQRHDFVYPAPATGWKTVAQSAIQKAVAYDDAQAPFTALKIDYPTRQHSAAPPTMDQHMYRALVVIKWYKGDGSLEATVKLAPDFYRIKTVFRDAFSNGDGYCPTVETTG